VFYWTQGKLDRILSLQKYAKKTKGLYAVAKKNIKINEETLTFNKKILSSEKQGLVEQYLNF
jgi:hypothetical protein